jgi:hypothetical protein
MIFRPLIVVEIEATTNEMSVVFLFFYIKKEDDKSVTIYRKNKKKGLNARAWTRGFFLRLKHVWPPRPDLCT